MPPPRIHDDRVGRNDFANRLEQRQRCDRLGGGKRGGAGEKHGAARGILSLDIDAPLHRPPALFR
jgi:hypothetical protein